MFLKSGLFLKNVDLTSVPTEHLASLVACVTWHLDIRNGGEVSLDITALTQYSGQGKCWIVNYFEYNDIVLDRYRKEVMSWLKKINWHVTTEGSYFSFKKSID